MRGLISLVRRALRRVIPQRSWSSRFAPGPRYALPVTDLALTRMSKLSIFREQYYLDHNPDVPKKVGSGARHFLKYGAIEQRNAIDIARLATQIGRVSQSLKTSPRSDAGGKAPWPKDVRVAIVCSSRGNVFMQNIAGELAGSLKKAGVPVYQLTEDDQPPPSGAIIIVAPHEFFYMGRADAWLKPEILERSFMLATEQAQTTWFRDSLPYLMSSKGVLDMYYHSSVLLREAGIPTHHYLPDPEVRPVRLGSAFKTHPIFASLPRAAKLEVDGTASIDSRPLGVCFFGAESAYREKYLWKSSAVLASVPSYVYLRRHFRGPLTNEDASLVDLAAHVATHSKITLNLHRDHFGAFEWFRIVQLAMCSGSVVLSDRGQPVPDFVSGEHYLECDGRHIPEMLDWLLHDEEGTEVLRRVQRTATDFLTTRCVENQSGIKLAKFLAENL
jgi:hypothetical protein